MENEKAKSTNDKYTLGVNENNKKFIKKYDVKNEKEINISFEDDETNVMEDVLRQLSKFFVEEILKA